MTKYKVVSYYTVNTSYEKEVQGLIQSLDRFNIDHDVIGIDQLGSWQSNTMYKATFISEMMKKHYPRPIVWIDADAVVQHPPHFFNMIDSDAAFYFRTKGGRVPRIPEDSELISAAMYFKTNDKARLLVDMWIEENKKDQRDLEQHNLQKVIPAWRAVGGNMSVLPQTYCKIFDSDPDYTVIVQNQASRRFRHEVGG